jgi:GTP-binding protein Era
MQRRTERELRDSDAALLMLNGEQTIGPGDRFIAAAVKAAEIPCVVAVNKADALDHARTVSALVASAELELPADAEIFPISARTGTGVDALLETLVGLLPEGPFLYPAAEATDLPPEVRLAELVREQVLHRTRQEIPHAVEVEVEEIEERSGGTLGVRALLWTESDSQKGILVGAGGRMVWEIGTAARAEIEALTGRRVHLDLAVRVRRSWRRDEALLDRLGIE